MQHLDEGRVHAWLDGALSAEEAADVERHVAECGSCAALVAEARGLIAGTSRIVTALDGVRRGVVPAGIGPTSAPTPNSRRRSWITPGRAGIAAVLVLALGTTLVMRGHDLKSTLSAPGASASAPASQPAFAPLSSSPASATPARPAPAPPAPSAVRTAANGRSGDREPVSKTEARTASPRMAAVTPADSAAPGTLPGAAVASAGSAPVQPQSMGVAGGIARPLPPAAGATSAPAASVAPPLSGGVRAAVSDRVTQGQSLAADSVAARNADAFVGRGSTAVVGVTGAGVASNAAKAQPLPMRPVPAPFIETISPSVAALAGCYEQVSPPPLPLTLTSPDSSARVVFPQRFSLTTGAAPGVSGRFAVATVDSAGVVGDVVPELWWDVSGTLRRVGLAADTTVAVIVQVPTVAFAGAAGALAGGGGGGGRGGGGGGGAAAGGGGRGAGGGGGGGGRGLGRGAAIRRVTAHGIPCSRTP